MSADDTPHPHVLTDTAQAAMLCLRRLADRPVGPFDTSPSPFGGARTITHALASDEVTRKKVWIVRDDLATHAQNGTLVSAWPLRYLTTAQYVEKPLIYVLKTDSIAGLQVALLEAAGRGVFLNTTQAHASRWPRHVKPDMPLWLSSDLSCRPYDPANAAEVHAIVEGALQTLYVEDEAAYYYVSLHDEDAECPTIETEAISQAHTGMYLLKSPTEGTTAHVRLLGAGKAVGRVIEAAERLQQDWGIASELWSCPSYTRLARDGMAVQQWNTLHPAASEKMSRLQACLGATRQPVIAVTDYIWSIAGQIGAYVDAPFAAIGAEAQKSAEPMATNQANRIVMSALRHLADEGHVPHAYWREALNRYGYAQHPPLFRPAS